MTVRAFTLIETLIYLALFSILIGGAVVCAFNLFEAEATGGTYTLLIEESDFILGKIRWAVNHEGIPSLPARGDSGEMLEIIVEDTSGQSTQVFKKVGTDIVLSHGDTDALLNASDVIVQKISFTHSDRVIEGIQTVLTLSARTPNGLLLTHTATNTVYMR